MKCRKCKEKLHEVRLYGEKIGAKQCLKQSCSKYGKPV